MPRKRSTLYKTGAGILCAGLLYGFVLIPLGVRLPCLFNRVTGLRCPGCGVTDLCLALLHGHFAPGYNWGLVLVSPALAWLGVGLWKNGACGKAEKAVSAALLVFLLVWGVLRNVWGI